MTRSPDSQIPSDAGQPAAEKRDDKALNRRQEGEANLRAATPVNVVSASSAPPAITPIQLDLFPGRACPLEAKPATDRSTARRKPVRRDGVEGGGTQRQHIQLTGEALFGPRDETPSGREAHKGKTRKRGCEAGRGIGGALGRDVDCRRASEPRLKEEAFALSVSYPPRRNIRPGLHRLDRPLRGLVLMAKVAGIRD